MTIEEYCREIESYLCRKNDGHLIRIVGPSFELVCGWAAQGIPFRIACQGIDRYFVRYYAKGARRRPVHIDFCEADVLDAFDAWRRAVGVRLPGHEGAAAAADTKAPKAEPARSSRSCLRADHTSPGTPHTAASGTRRGARTGRQRNVGVQRTAGTVAGRSPRARVMARLAELDRQMLDAARVSPIPRILQAAREEAARAAAAVPRSYADGDVRAGGAVGSRSPAARSRRDCRPLASSEGAVPPSRRSLTPGADIELVNRETGRRRPHACATPRAGRARRRRHSWASRFEFASNASADRWRSPRRSPSCSRLPIAGSDTVDGACGGSVYAHIAYPRQLASEGRESWPMRSRGSASSSCLRRYRSRLP